MVKKSSFFRFLDPKILTVKAPKKQLNFYPKKEKMEEKLENKNIYKK